MHCLTLCIILFCDQYLQDVSLVVGLQYLGSRFTILWRCQIVVKDFLPTLTHPADNISHYSVLRFPSLATTFFLTLYNTLSIKSFLTQLLTVLILFTADYVVSICIYGVIVYCHLISD